MNILLFGGSFNPPHLGHEIVIRQALELIPTINQLWLLPAYHHAFGKGLAPATDRLTMCQLLLQKMAIPKINICTLEIDSQSAGSTYQTLQSLKSLHPTHTFSFLMGSDQLPTFNKWNNYSALLNEMHFYVYPRNSHHYDITYPNMELLQSPTQIITNISSSLIRHRIKHHLPIDHIVSSNILKYITNHHLYNYDL